MPDQHSHDMVPFARIIGSSDGTGETVTGALNAGRFLAEVERALELLPGSGSAACLAEIKRIKAEEAAFVAHLNSEIASNRAAICDLTVRSIILDAVREASDALDP